MGSKGNPAGKRMMNVKLKEKRARSWARAQVKKKVNREANEARMKANLAELRELGASQIVREHGRRQKLESPGSALYRVKRKAA
jgi:hypothetical protein